MFQNRHAALTMATDKINQKTKHIKSGKTIDFNYTHSELEVQYPKTWFDKNLGHKPRITIPKFSRDIDTLELVKGGIAEGNLTLDTAKAFIYQQFLEVKATPITTWTSFGRQLGTTNQAITPWDLVEIVHGEGNHPTESVDGGTHKWSERAVLLYVLSIYRISKVTNNEYRETLEQRLKEQLEVEGGREMSYGGAFQLYSAWSKDANYMKMIAAIDMFLYKFKTHPYAIMRMGTLGSRFRDCASLGSFGFAMKILGISSEDLMDWVFVGETGNEILRMTAIDQETCLSESYFPYQVDFQLVERSAYSSVANPNFFLWVHVIGALLGHKRSQNARFIFEGCLSDIGLNSILVAWVFGQGAKRKEIAAGEVGEQDYEESSAREKLWFDTQGRNPNEWFALLKKSGFKPPKCVLRMVKKRQDRIRDARPGTVGEYVKTQFSY